MTLNKNNNSLNDLLASIHDYTEGGSYRDAEFYTMEGVKLYPDSLKLQTYYSLLPYYQKQWTKAILRLENLLQKYGDKISYEVFEALSLCYQATDQLKKAQAMSANLDCVEISNYNKTNLAIGKPTAQSSIYSVDSYDIVGACNGKKTGRYGFHTLQERQPWWQVDLQTLCEIDEIKIYNSLVFPERARSVDVFTSKDCFTWQLVYSNDERYRFGEIDGNPLTIRLETQVDARVARFVRLQLRLYDYFHLDEVEIYGQPLKSRTINSGEVAILNRELSVIKLEKPISLVMKNGQTATFYGLSKSNNCFVGYSSNKTAILKIELEKHEEKKHGLVEEARIIQELNSKNCISCPQLLWLGKLDSSIFRDFSLNLVDYSKLPKQLNAMVIEYVETEDSVPLKDLLLAVQEQRKLGWFQGDLKPGNVRMCPIRKNCFIIDYDQAQKLSNEQVRQPLSDFLIWCNLNPMWRFNFPGITFKDVMSELTEGRLNIGLTKLMMNSETTMSPSKVYHTIDIQDVFANGERNLEARLELLDSVKFFSGEKVLDIGCNSGLLCEYLARKGCAVTGVDLDPYIVRIARILANIRRDDIRFFCLDLDRVDSLEKYDTIMLFSILHHTQNIHRNAALLASSCQRIIIECRLVEKGFKPANGSWISTTKWAYASLTELISGLETYFPGFVFNRNYGMADRSRYILELIKI